MRWIVYHHWTKILLIFLCIILWISRSVSSIWLWCLHFCDSGKGLICYPLPSDFARQTPLFILSFLLIHSIEWDRRWLHWNQGREKEEREKRRGWMKGREEGSGKRMSWSSSLIIISYDQQEDTRLMSESLFLLSPALLPKMSSSQFPVSVYNFFSTVVICELLLDNFFDTKTETEPKTWNEGNMYLPSFPGEGSLSSCCLPPQWQARGAEILFASFETRIQNEFIGTRNINKCLERKRRGREREWEKTREKERKEDRGSIQGCIPSCVCNTIIV